MTTVYISIGNSDDKLTQGEWAHFVAGVHSAVDSYATVVHGRWMSLPDSPWQNACWCLEVSEKATLHLRDTLTRTATSYRQESIAWAVAETEFLRPA